MSQKNQKKIRLGRKEKEIIEFIKQNGGSVWKQDIFGELSHSPRYCSTLEVKLRKLEKKGLIEIRLERNPATGHLKQRVYLKQ